MGGRGVGWRWVVGERGGGRVIGRRGGGKVSLAGEKQSGLKSERTSSPVSTHSKRKRHYQSERLFKRMASDQQVRFHPATLHSISWQNYYKDTAAAVVLFNSISVTGGSATIIEKHNGFTISHLKTK